MNNWKQAFQTFWEERNRHYVDLQPIDHAVAKDIFQKREKVRWERIRDDFRDRKVELKRSTSQIDVLNVVEEDPYVNVWYRISINWDLVQREQHFRQSWVEHRTCLLKNHHGWWVMEDKLVEEEGKGVLDLPAEVDGDPWPAEGQLSRNQTAEQGETYRGYNRQQAVGYAHRWWNSYNPKFKHFDVDCTNYVSQCLWAGGAPMTYSQNRSKGWWYRFETQPNWSFSWAVAHSLRWYLAGSTSGLRAREVQSARELEPGDVICYDFNGDGRWQHNTIVVAKDANNEPLVNAHTTNSQNRYWAYRDSYAWTPNIQYKFFHIIV
ncbi:hypothetical protein J2S00_000908 [Caldalkalibacillus uzonensis]|uniref:Putative amidase domain-containing protein n=1 Tax=Caldalkalibacillus uzonensis TaxID=353224 RepID=A0ABU0CNY6_9BACI|nr:amidase domain-containing protein [Caldalkalibacillus uzonensis]MDQ0338125.1 hypothetical protein [Caldalkalibacillus uzonensis]